jgi:hypothetical protein
MHAVADRGLFWGNRGRLLNARGEIARRSQGRNWLVCVLEFKGRRRTQWRPDRLTELYVLDEATAFAAGHRPCGECRHQDYQRFKAAWSRANPAAGSSARDIDRRLHADRLGPSGPPPTSPHSRRYRTARSWSMTTPSGSSSATAYTAGRSPATAPRAAGSTSPTRFPSAPRGPPSPPSAPATSRSSTPLPNDPDGRHRRTPASPSTARGVVRRERRRHRLPRHPGLVPILRRHPHADLQPAADDGRPQASAPSLRAHPYLTRGDSSGGAVGSTRGRGRSCCRPGRGCRLRAGRPWWTCRPSRT